MTEKSIEKPNVSVIHILISAVVTFLLWMMSFSILFPFFIALLLSAKLRDKLFSWFFCTFCSGLFPGIIPMRKTLFKQLDATNKNLKMLEIGVGGGANFEYYPENCEVTLLDMNENFDVEIRKRLDNFPNLKVDRTVFAMAEDMKGVSDSEYDVVVCTHLLCSVKDVTAVLKEVRRVLKTDGKFIYMEHVAFPKGHVAFWIQKLITPLWRVYMNGCCLDRSSQRRISDHFFRNSYKITYPLFLPLFFRPHVMGIATK